MTLTRGVVIPADHLDRRRLPEDLALLADAGARQVRVGLDWPWMQPSPGALDGDAVEFYVGAAQLARSLGIDLHYTLLDRDVPHWFEDEGGFGDERFALHWWPRWVERCAECFGDSIAGWVPIEHPLAIANRLHPQDPRRHGEVLDTIVTAWRDAWRILRGGPPVITAFGVEIVRPVDDTVPAAQAARRLDGLRFQLWFRGLRDGVVTIPGRADRELADLAGSFDVLGLVIRHERDTLALVHRSVEQIELTGKPVTTTLLTPAGSDADREQVVERYLEQAADAASGLPLTTVAVAPTFDLTGDERGIITRDRDLKDSARLFFGHDDAADAIGLAADR